jgi:hypothetical protein
MKADCFHLKAIPKDYNCSNYTAPKKGQKPISKYERMWKAVPWPHIKYYTRFGQQFVPNCNLLGYNKV